MPRIVEMTPFKAVVAFDMDRHQPAWPWTIEAMMQDVGSVTETEEPELYAKVRDYLLDDYNRRTQDEDRVPPLWEFDIAYRAYVDGYRAGRGEA